MSGEDHFDKSKRYPSENNTEHLTYYSNRLLKVLQKYPSMYNGTLG